MMTLSSLADGPWDLPPLAQPPRDDADGQTRQSTQSRQHSRPRRAFDTWLGNWWSVALRGPELFLAVAAMILASLAVAGFFSLPAVGTGLLLLVPALWGAWGLGRWQRRLLLAFTGVDIGPSPAGATQTWRRVLGLDQPRLAALAWAGLHALWGLLASVLVLVILTEGVSLLSVPLVAGWAPDGEVNLLVMSVSSPIGYAAAWLVGFALVVGTPWLARGLASVDIALGRWLLGVDPQRQLREMSQRVRTLTTTREETVDSVEAERRRIERDLHDGPQQRLVSIAMTLGLARTQLDTDPAAARALIDEAHASSKEAITEMRQVARGIVPPILADRGLDAAVSALADRSPIPVAVTTRLHDRLDPTIEAIAYFCVSESLTNIAKHAGATRASLDLGVARALIGDRLAITVTDDGRGGAIEGAGSGLTGLRQRVASVDGDLHVQSPVGGGTTVSITLPLRGRRSA
ncbi:MAG: sensor histidine kinase [Ornithinimicrobium sp.]|uniref:sensor histidine kinase n=1 Tax=Ornithinimicrobium sp. TaxID=1977084 RepID=UPI0026DFA735|nr:sensor histidine kinase [Ornithinimicrobium sp.]MDO5740144.1 sensor histidine kinase [Ornithinimicrobium sp.]